MPELNAKVVERMEFAPGAFILRVAPEGWELPAFIPGQYCVLGLFGSSPRSALADPEPDPPEPGKLLLRSYCVASTSESRPYVEVYVTLIRSGALTPRLYELQIGDMLYLGRTFAGVMTLERVPEGRDVIFIATGTGLAPYMSMLRTLVGAGGLRRRCVVIHAAHHSWDLGYRGELETLSRMSQDFTYIPVLSAPEEELVPWSGPTGSVEDVWKSGLLKVGRKEHPSKDGAHVFLCGNPSMIDGALRFLREEGFVEHTGRTPGQVHVERYW